VSVIVPVYNVSGYLKRCLDSLLGQTLREIEVIAVDDGSTDGSADILDEYAARDPRLLVVRQENMGLSAARNTGLSLAGGEYIGFVDSDDAAEPEMFRLMARAAEENGCDAVQCGHISVADGEDVRKLVPCLPKDEVLTVEALFEAMPQAHTKQCLCFCWRFLFSRRLLRENGIRFDPGLKYCEDTPFNLHALLKAKSVVVIAPCLYRYTHRPGSIIRARVKPGLEDHLNRQYLMKRAMLKESPVGKNRAFMDDMYYYSLYTLMRMMTGNLYHGDKADIMSGLKKMIRLEMIRDSFKSIPLSRFKNEPVVYLIMLAAKYKMARLLKFLNDRIYKE